jgi:hypothetical protein
MDEITTKNVSETQNYIAWVSSEPDGEKIYHLELNNVTLHFFQEEWDEVIELISNIKED